MAALFDPITVRGVTFPNRIGISPMCMYSAGTDGLPTPWHAVHLGSRAVGGAGLVFTEVAGVSPGGRTTDGDLGLWNRQQQDALAPIADFIAQNGSVPGIQLGHGGRKAGRHLPWDGHEPIPESEWGPLFAPSAIPFHDFWSAPTAMSTEQIAATVADFADAAERSIAAGFQTIELHFAHGYLVHQFLSPLANHRTDEYGGGLAQRARFAVEIARSVRDTVGEGVPLFARLSAVDWADGGLTLEDSVEISRMLAAAGVDVIDCSSGAVVDNDRPAVAPHYQVPFASRIRADTTVLTAAVGVIRDPHGANSIIEDGDADFVLIGRASLQDAYWPRTAARELGQQLEPRLPLPYRRAVEGMARLSQW